METNDSAYSAAKLREFVKNRVKQNDDLYQHTAIVEPGSDAEQMLSFMEAIYDSPDDLPHYLQATKAARDLRRSAATRHVGKSVDDLPSFVVGLTERDADVSSVEAYAEIQNSLVNNHAPYLTVIFGSPNTGKTTLAVLYVELWNQLATLKYDTDRDPVVVSNASSLGIADYSAQSIGEFRELLFGSDDWFSSDGSEGEPPTISPDTPVLFLFDECSTHLDARTNSRQVAQHYTPLLKRFAKIKCDAIHIGHSGYDVHKELRRDTLMTEFIFKEDKKTADVYERMDEDKGADHKYQLNEIPEPSTYVDPDDFAPWSWDE